MEQARGRGRNWGELVWTLVRTDFKARYHGTLGGFVWALLKPVAMFLVLLAVFSFVFASDPVYKQNLLIGLFLWDFFAEGTKVGIVSLHQKGYLLTRTRFPAWVVVVTSLSNALITLVVFSLTVVLFLVVTGQPPSLAGVLLYAFYVCGAVVLVIGISLAGSVLFLRYRDLNQIWEVVTQAGFFIAPIIYPLSILPERFHLYLYLWPPTPVIQFSRAALGDGGLPSLRAHVLFVGMVSATLAVGLSLYRLCAPRAVEHL